MNTGPTNVSHSGHSSTAGLSILTVLTLAFVFAGCGHDKQMMECYMPLGPSANQRNLNCLSDQLIRVFAYQPEVGVPETPEQAEDVRQSLDIVVSRAIGARPGSPAFRSLCALSNRYFGQWDRLVIVERLGFINDEYDFCILGQSKGSLAAITTFLPNSSEENQELKVLPQYPASLDVLFNELEKASAMLPQRLLWFENVDWPLYIVHYIKSDGRCFSFGICGDIDRIAGEMDPTSAELSYAVAGELLIELRGTGIASLNSAEGRKIAKAGLVYGRLLACVCQHLFCGNSSPY